MAKMAAKKSSWVNTAPEPPPLGACAIAYARSAMGSDLRVYRAGEPGRPGILPHTPRRRGIFLARRAAGPEDQWPQDAVWMNQSLADALSGADRRGRPRCQRVGRRAQNHWRTASQAMKHRE